MNQLQLDWPAWRLSWSEYAKWFDGNTSWPEMEDLSRTESACDWFDNIQYQPAPDELRDAWINEQ